MTIKHILVVDDSMELGRLLQASVRTLDPEYKVVLVPSAEEAMLEVTRPLLNLLVADIRLPGMSGFELAKKARARHPKLKLIFITGLTDAGIQQQAIDAGADFFFHKPMHMPEFLDAVETCLGKSAASLVEQPPALSQPELSAGRLATELAELRHALGAQAAYLLDADGRTIARAGEVAPEKPEDHWMPLIMAAVSAGDKLARQLGSDQPCGVQVYQGSRFELAFSPLGTLTAVLVFNRGKHDSRLALALSELLALRREFGRPLEMPQPVAAPAVEPGVVEVPAATAPAPEPAAPPAVEEAPLEGEEDFAALSDKKGKAAFKKKELDEFWEKASHIKTGSLRTPDALSYDQARQLGLAPGEQEEK
jgi:DNA-binding response OmpR family regulator